MPHTRELLGDWHIHQDTVFEGKHPRSPAPCDEPFWGRWHFSKGVSNPASRPPEEVTQDLSERMAAEFGFVGENFTRRLCEGLESRARCGIAAQVSKTEAQWDCDRAGDPGTVVENPVGRNAVKALARGDLAAPRTDTRQTTHRDQAPGMLTPVTCTALVPCR